MKQTEINDELRARMAQIAIDAYKAEGFEVLQTAGGTWYIPCLDANGNEKWYKMAGIIPTKAVEEEGTDGYSLAEEYRIKCEGKAIKKAEAERAAAEKKEKREAKAKAKAKEEE